MISYVILAVLAFLAVRRLGTNDKRVLYGAVAVSLLGAFSAAGTFIGFLVLAALPVGSAVLATKYLPSKK